MPHFKQVAHINQHLVGNLGQQLLFKCAVGQQAPQRARIAGHMGAAFGAVQITSLGSGLQHELAQGHCLTDSRSKTFAAVFANKAVGVMLGRQKQKLDTAHIGGKGQGGIERLARCAAASAVTIKAEDNRVGKAKQLLYVLCRAGRAECGYGIGKAQLRQRHHVHIALGHQGVAMGA